jgi:hypothetical protein
MRKQPDFGAATAMDMDSNAIVNVKAMSPYKADFEMDAKAGNTEVLLDASAEFYPDKTRYDEVVTQFDLENFLAKNAINVSDDVKDVARDGIKMWKSLTEAQSEAVTEVTATASSAAPSLATKFQELPSAGKLGVAAAGYMALKMIPKTYLFGGLALFMFARMKNKETTTTTTVTEESSAPVAGMC